MVREIFADQTLGLVYMLIKSFVPTPATGAERAAGVLFGFAG